MNPPITQPNGICTISPGAGASIDSHVTVAEARIKTNNIMVALAVPATVMMPPSQRVTGPSFMGSTVGGAHESLRLSRFPRPMALSVSNGLAIAPTVTTPSMRWVSGQCQNQSHRNVFTYLMDCHCTEPCRACPQPHPYRCGCPSCRFSTRIGCWRHYLRVSHTPGCSCVG